MAPIPIYSSNSLEGVAFHLRYTWTGWPSGNTFPDQPERQFFQELDANWERDGIRRLEMNWNCQSIQLTCSVKPTVSPILFTTRIKGRLQHALRHYGSPTKFSRKVSFRTIGNNRTETVQQYIDRQVEKEKFVDRRFVEVMQGYTYTDPNICLKEPTETLSGRYWYNLHLVLATSSRSRITDRESLSKLDQLCSAIAQKKDAKIASRSIMPDHLHLALRGNLEICPEEIALAFMNNTAFQFRQNEIWKPSYYVGSFGEYDMNAVRK